MSHRTRRHLRATVLASVAVLSLSAIVAANGFRDFGSSLWLFDLATVAVLAYSLTVLASRAASFEDGLWKRAAAFAATSGVVLSLLAFVRFADLNVSGVAVAVVLSGALGAALGLAAVEGLRWAQGVAPASRAV